MQTEIEVKERATYAIIEIMQPNGHLTRIEVRDNEDVISIATVDGGMGIYPHSTNKILIKTLES